MRSASRPPRSSSPTAASTSAGRGSDPKLIAKPDAVAISPTPTARAAVLRPARATATSSSRCGRSRGSTDGYFYAGRGDRSDRRTRSARDAAQRHRRSSPISRPHRRNIELGFASVFIMLSLTMLISAVWMGLTFANQLVGPIRRLIRATDEVASGNLYVQVPTRQIRGRSRPSRRDLQQDDGGAAPAARNA